MSQASDSSLTPGRTASIIPDGGLTPAAGGYACHDGSQSVVSPSSSVAIWASSRAKSKTSVFAAM